MKLTSRKAMRATWLPPSPRRRIPRLPQTSPRTQLARMATPGPGPRRKAVQPQTGRERLPSLPQRRRARANDGPRPSFEDAHTPLRRAASGLQGSRGQPMRVGQQASRPWRRDISRSAGPHRHHADCVSPRAQGILRPSGGRPQRTLPARLRTRRSAQPRDHQPEDGHGRDRGARRDA